MKLTLRGLSTVLLASLVTLSSHAQITSFRHVVVVVQENRTPDNLFQGLCGPNRTLCPTPYDLQNFGIDHKGRKVLLAEVPLGYAHDPDHSHLAFVTQCHLDSRTNQCRMDGLSSAYCPNCSFEYVNPADVLPYVTMAQQYGWANFMFQTNQGPSFPAHQFIFGGTSAPDTNSDHNGIFASENMSGGITAGCIAAQGTMVTLIRPPGIEDSSIYPCFEHTTLPDILPSGETWRYYTPSAGRIWTAPTAIKHICGPNQSFGGQCVGQEWIDNVDLNPTGVLTDIAKCSLRSVSWVIPTGKNSDHPSGNNQNGGPSWVASIVNAIGKSTACDGGTGYWKNTAIFITWDDWGGFYDHEPPTILAQPEGDYQYGFRVPLVVVSAYTPVGYINNDRHDFGSILRFIEHNFGLTEGALTFADDRASHDLTGLFELKRMPRVFVPISAPLSLQYFLRDKTSPTDPDDY